MRSVAERVANWEEQSKINGNTRLPISVLPPEPRRSVAIVQQRPQLSRNSVDPRQTRTAIQSMEFRNNDTTVLLYNSKPASPAFNQQAFHRVSSAGMSGFVSPDDHRSGNYEKEYLKIRGTMNFNKGDQPPPPRNTVNMQFESDRVKVIDHNRVEVQDHSKFGSVRFASMNLGATTNPLKSEMVDKQVYDRTQQIINALFGPRGEKELTYSNYHNQSQANLSRATNLNRSIHPPIRVTNVPIKEIQSVQTNTRKQKKTHGRFQDL